MTNRMTRLSEPRLEGLVDEAFAPLEIGCEPIDQGIEGHLKRNAAPRGVKDRNVRLGAAPPVSNFDPPHAPAAIAPVFLEHTRPGSEAIREQRAQFLQIGVAVGVRAPA